MDVAFKQVPPKEIESKDDVQWAQYTSFCQRKINEKIVNAKSKNIAAAPKFEIGSAIDIPGMGPEVMKDDKISEKPNIKHVPIKELNVTPAYIPKEEDEEGAESYDDYIKNLENNAQ
jgi:hypothetical protein